MCIPILKEIICAFFSSTFSSYFLTSIFRYICIRSVYNLTVEYSSLTVTLVITLRKFISVVISIFYFKNPFTLYHWIGTILVFSGTLLFVDILQLVTKGDEVSKEEVSKDERDKTKKD